MPQKPDGWILLVWNNDGEVGYGAYFAKLEVAERAAKPYEGKNAAIFEVRKIWEAR